MTNFDLNREIQDWCAKLLPAGYRGDEERLEELTDHLHCEVEGLVEEGMTPQEAFAQATDRMGEANIIIKEFSKNQSIVARLCALDRRLAGIEPLHDPVLKKAASRMMLGNALLWAAAIIGTALLASDAEHAGYLVPLIFIPLWVASYQLINSTFKRLARQKNSS